MQPVARQRLGLVYLAKQMPSAPQDRIAYLSRVTVCTVHAPAIIPPS